MFKVALTVLLVSGVTLALRFKSSASPGEGEDFLKDDPEFDKKATTYDIEHNIDQELGACSRLHVRAPIHPSNPSFYSSHSTPIRHSTQHTLALQESFQNIFFTFSQQPVSHLRYCSAVPSRSDPARRVPVVQRGVQRSAGGCREEHHTVETLGAAGCG